MPTPTLHRIKVSSGVILIGISLGAAIGWVFDISWLASWGVGDNNKIAVPTIVAIFVSGIFALVESYTYNRRGTL